MEAMIEYFDVCESWPYFPRIALFSPVGFSPVIRMKRTESGLVGSVDV